MLPSRNLPASFDRVLSPVRGCFTEPSFQTFVLFCGFVSAVGERTVTGMLISSGYSGIWEAYSFTCLWYGVLGAESVTVIMVRAPGQHGYGIAIVSTDLDATAEALIQRYARRWSIEVTVEEGKEIAGVADARNRTQHAVERTVPFCFYSMSILIVWFATAGINHDRLIAERRRTAPWYTTKTAVSFADILTTARRVLTASQFRPVHAPDHQTRENDITRLALESIAA